PLAFIYTDHRSETDERHATPIGVRWGTSEWHRDPQWLLLAFDHDRQAECEFAMADIKHVGLQADRFGELRRRALSAMTDLEDWTHVNEAQTDACIEDVR
ncbi:hypothetical protein, partial [Stenotrophomonas maltophilia]|uniref:hypothetical protein n=2 Tax=Stenotrophomonas maltophilia TaxID=40324 RepID=UPI0013DA596A